MSSATWTQDDLRSSSGKLTGRFWRVVEAQHIVSTLKLTDDLEEQTILEEILEETKPVLQDECRHLNFLLFTPFRYSASNPYGSRFRKANAADGVFYASEHPFTAIAEVAFYRTLFYGESPDTPWPSNPGEYTAFASEAASNKAVDISKGPLSTDAGLYHFADYSAGQSFAETVRSFGYDLIRYRSLRDPKGLANVAILHCSLFTKADPVDRQSWKLHLDSKGARAICESPRVALPFDRTAFAGDPRMAGYKWDR